MGALRSGLEALRLAPAAVAELSGDASRRRFFRVTLADGTTVVAALYPDALVETARADHAVQEWGWQHDLPVPRPLGRSGVVVVSEDLGSEDLGAARASRGQGVMDLVVDALALFQSCGWEGLPTPPFDAAFFRQELAVFQARALDAGLRSRAAVKSFLDDLAERVSRHPYRLVHRDFHCNNLFLFQGRVRTVDFQDMRGGPDTYDLASLLRERGGAMLADEGGTLARAADRFGWRPGWESRYLECAAQRGLKVIGTFLGLAQAGRRSYLDFLPAVRERAREALEGLGAPRDLCGAVAAPP